MARRKQFQGPMNEQDETIVEKSRDPRIDDGDGDDMVKHHLGKIKEHLDGLHKHLDVPVDALTVDEDEEPDEDDMQVDTKVSKRTKRTQNYMAARKKVRGAMKQQQQEE